MSAAPARFTRHGDGLVITVDDRAASYPLTIDPWVQAATLTAQSGADLQLGITVALSADGSTLAASSNTVIAIYTRPASGWAGAITPLATLTIPGVAQNSGENGRSLALSADGSTLVAGPAVFTLDTVGAVDVYVRPAGGWANTSTPSATLPNPTGAANEVFGSAVALSPDGATLIVGTRNNPAGGIARGAAFVYTKPAGGWASTSTPAATLTNAASVDADLLGNTVALSADGSTLIAAPYEDPWKNANPGVVAVFTRPAGGWASSDTPTTTFALANGKFGDRFGNSVALSADGRTLAVGTPRFVTERGSVYVYRNFLTNASLSGLSLSQGTLSPAFAAATRAYAASVPYNVSSLTVTPTLADSTATVTVNGAPVTSGSASGAISLKGGANVITVIVTAEDGTTRTTTTITVTRPYGVVLPMIVR